jgi:hypothetical protein
MTAAASNDHIPRLRDTLYLDVDRVRALLAQLRGGVVEEIVERRRSSGEKRLGARVLGLEAGGSVLDEGSIEETMLLQDALLDIFEEAAEESAFFSTADFDDPTIWRNGELHGQLAPGQLVKVTAPTQVLVPEHVSEEIGRAFEMIEAFAYYEEAQDPTPIPEQKPIPPQAKVRNKQQQIDPDAFRQAAINIRTERLLGASIDSVIAMRLIFEKLLGQGISVRVFPCGEDSLDLTLSGHLSATGGSLRHNPEALFAKYGWGSSSWTSVSQIATVPPPGVTDRDADNSTEPADEEPDDADEELEDAESFDRGKAEDGRIDEDVRGGRLH